MDMEYYTGAIIIVVMCAIILCIVSLRKKAEFILNFLLRSILGTAAVFFLNQLPFFQTISLQVGINPWTVLTSGCLGFPGLILLYGISLSKIL